MIQNANPIYRRSLLQGQMLGRADTHVHTKYSGVHRMGFLRFPESVAEPKQVVEKAREVGLNVVCITDHNTIQGALKAKSYADKIEGIEVVVGEEVSTRDGELIGLYLTEQIPEGLPVEDTIELIRNQDGIVAAPHPFSLHCPALGERIKYLDLDAVEVLNSGHLDGYCNRKAEEFCDGERWSCLGGSDSHFLKTIGYAFTSFEGTTAEDLRRSIEQRKVKPGGKSMTIDKAVAWTVDVVIKSDILMLKSIFGPITGEDPDDPIICRVNHMPGWQKLVAIAGSFIYLTPPVPFLAGYGATRYLHKLYDGKVLGLRRRSDKVPHE